MNTNNYIDFYEKIKLYIKINKIIIINYMDWYEIEYIYPKSYQRFIDIMFPNVGILSISILKNFDIKKLYYFFDKEGYYLILELNNNDNWSYVVKKDNWILSGDNETKKTREEIEIIGFNYCFKQMEMTINCKEKV